MALAHLTSLLFPVLQVHPVCTSWTYVALTTLLPDAFYTKFFLHKEDACSNTWM